MSVVVVFPDGPSVGPFADDAAADRYLSDFPAACQDGVQILPLRVPKDYPAPTRADFDARVP